jgi:O-antigen/teichoic acid export membrane protein
MPQQTEQDQSADTAPRNPSFVVNVMWSWAGTAINIFVGLFLSRFIVRSLGEERYGVWALVWSMIDYLWFFDLGFNAAVTNFLARFRARNETENINAVINTALFYFTGVSAILVTLAFLVSRNVDWLFPRILPQSRRDLSTLILITGVSWGLFVLLHIFTSALDGFQRFDLTTRAWVVKLVVSSGGSVVLLKMGYGLREMGIAFMLGQLIAYLMNYFSFRRVFPQLRISFGSAHVAMIKQMVGYGVPSFMANASNLALNQTTPFFIARFTSMADVGFFTLPMRVLQYAVDAVSRVGLITRSNAAEREASGRKESVWSLGVFSNRYCFTLFAPLSIYLLIYGRELIRIWITPVYADRSAPLLPILVPAIAFVMAGQFNSSAILFGLGAHQRYAYGLMVEAALNVVGMLIFVPRYGIFGAACVSSSLMLLIRGIYTPMLVCKSLDASVARYMAAIYVRPLLTAIPVAAGGLLLKQYVTGRNWTELILAGLCIASSYLALALFTCIDPSHRRMLFGWIDTKWVGWKAS